MMPWTDPIQLEIRVGEGSSWKNGLGNRNTELWNMLSQNIGYPDPSPSLCTQYNPKVPNVGVGRP